MIGSCLLCIEMKEKMLYSDTNDHHFQILNLVLQRSRIALIERDKRQAKDFV